MAELRAYNPSWQDRLGGLLADWTSPDLARRVVGSAGAGRAGPMAGAGLLDMTPLGGMFAFNDYQRSGNALDAAGALPIPGARAVALAMKPVAKRVGAEAASDLVGALRAKYPTVTLDISGTPETGLTLSRIVVPKDDRGRGIGTLVMRDLLNAADDMGAQVNLTPTADFGGSVPRLRRFYQNLGFVKNAGKNKDFGTRETMLRVPNAPMVKSRSNPAVKPERRERRNLSAAGLLGLGAIGGLLGDDHAQAQHRGLLGYQTGGGF